MARAPLPRLHPTQLTSELCTSSLLPVTPPSRPSFSLSRPCPNTPFPSRDTNVEERNHHTNTGRVSCLPLLSRASSLLRRAHLFDPFPSPHPHQHLSSQHCDGGGGGAVDCISVSPPCRHNPSASQASGGGNRPQGLSRGLLPFVFKRCCVWITLFFFFCLSRPPPPLRPIPQEQRSPPFLAPWTGASVRV